MTKTQNMVSTMATIPSARGLDISDKSNDSETEATSPRGSRGNGLATSSGQKSSRFLGSSGMSSRLLGGSNAGRKSKGFVRLSRVVKMGRLFKRSSVMVRTDKMKLQN